MLPRYTKQYNDQDPLLPNTIERRESTEEGTISTETAPPTYPPAGPSTVEGRHNVEYSYGPVFPRKGNVEHVVGALGNSKQETIQIVQRGIKGLAAVDPNRMTFKIFQGPGEGAHWATVMDEAWERFHADPPKRLGIVLSDLPGDEQLRKRRDRLETLQMFLGLIVVLLMSVGFVLLVNSGSGDKDKR